MTGANRARFKESYFETMPDSEKFSLMDELAEEGDGVPSRVERTLPAPSSSDPAPAGALPAPGIPAPVVPKAVIPDQAAAAFAAGDVYDNDSDSFRIDSVPPEGNIVIRFRSQEFGEKLDFFGSVAVFLKNLENETKRHEGEWFFGSPDELSAFITENKYVFQKHGGKQGD